MPAWNDDRFGSMRINLGYLIDFPLRFMLPNKCRVLADELQFQYMYMYSKDI